MGKFKSAEIIEDSDDEDGEADADGGGNEMADEFARMVGESLAAAPSTEAEGEDEEEYEEEDDDEGELGGARLVVNDSGGGELSLALRLASWGTRADPQVTTIIRNGCSMGFPRASRMLYDPHLWRDLHVQPSSPARMLAAFTLRTAEPPDRSQIK
jgi:hypothetical protein